LGQEERLLLDNMRHTLAINNATSVHFHNELSCVIALEKIDKELLRIFRAEGDLRFKSDICRAAALYLEGGVYNDDDQINYRPVFPYLKNDTTFGSVQADHELRAFVNSFIAVTPCHPLMKQHLELLRDVRTPGNPAVHIIEPDGLIGPLTLAEAYVRHFNLGHGVRFTSSAENGTQLLHETRLGLLNSTKPNRNGHNCEFGFYDPEDEEAIYACTRP